MSERSASSYAGDLTPQDAYQLLKDTPEALLVDVRTRAEWTFVGFADLSAENKQSLLVEWQQFPAMDVNASFVGEVEAQAAQAVGSDLSKDAPLLFLCRSGVRSMSAAAAMTAAGYTRCFNVLEGFEGDLDEHHHRGQSGGWKARGLPWVQR